MVDLVIIGAGPAGLSAAITTREYGLSVIVMDEFPQAGGRLLGQLHEELNGEWWNGIKESKILYDKAQELETDIRLGVSVHHIENLNNHFVVHTNSEPILAKNVLIATGAAESPAPIPGWTLPGVMSIGAAQVMTNVHRVRVGEKGIIVGVNMLSAAIARELLLADVDLYGMALPVRNVVSEDQSNPREVMDRLIHIAHLAPSKFIKFGSKFAKFKFIRNIALNFYPKKGIKMWDMPIHLQKAIKKINGTNQVESVTMVDVTPNGDIIRNTEKTIEVDFVCIAGELYPLGELAAVIGCPFEYNEALGGHVPIHNRAMETPIAGVYVAGNITGIESAKVAREQGEVAGLSVVKSLINDSSIKSEILKSITKVQKIRDEAIIQFHPHINKGRKKILESYNVKIKNKTVCKGDENE